MHQKRREYNPDQIAYSIFGTLLRDFQTVEGQDFAKDALRAHLSGISELRDYVWPTLGVIDPMRFKRWHQLQNILKRHRFCNDLYTDDELVERTHTAYLDAQSVFCTERPMTIRLSKVFGRARSICRDILGKLDQDELLDAIRIGKRATQGNPLSKSYLDMKMGLPSAFTCPSKLKGWMFNTYLPTDPLLSRVVRQIFKRRSSEQRPDLAADSLTLVCVPKTWKIHRGITPLPNIALFYSYALGELVTRRLRDKGLDIRKLQPVHQKLARRYSVTRSHVTADLSRASDSVMQQHLNRVLPREWYNALKATFTNQISISNKMHYTASVLPMGNGATFPVETLFFYCIIKAIGDLAHVDGVFSVYGDDLIYPRRIHRYAMAIFSDLGISVNVDKTFSNSFFRESCGGDFYRGIDVRPALLPENKKSYKRLEFVEYLYKVLNGLCHRWDPSEIPCTVNYLLRELVNLSHEIYLIPTSFPDTAGWKVRDPITNEWWIPYSFPKLKYHHDTQSHLYHFKALCRKAPKKRIVKDEAIYLWDALRLRSQPRNIPWKFWESWLSTLPDWEAPVCKGSEKELSVPLLDQGPLETRSCTVFDWT